MKFKSLKLNSKCTIHIRGGDYKNTIVKPSKKFYEGSIKFLNKKKISIITDDKEYASNLLPDYSILKSKKNHWDYLTNDHHFSTRIKKDFLNIARSKYNIISASTFSFWASYIGSLFLKKKIVAPAFWFGNRVSNSWWSPMNMYIKDWIYIDKYGEKVKNFNINSRPLISVHSKQNKYLNFIIRKIINLISY